MQTKREPQVILQPATKNTWKLGNVFLVSSGPIDTPPPPNLVTRWVDTRLHAFSKSIQASLQGMADLDQIKGGQQSRTSGAGALKPVKNRRVHHCTMGTTAQT